MKKKVVNIVLWSIFGITLFVGVCIFPYPALFMGNTLPKQPELSPSEKQYFDKLKKENSWNEIGRMYVNVDSFGQDIMIKNRPIDFSNKYRYTLSLETEDTACYYANYTPESGAYFAEHIKDSICLNSPHLIEIYIDIAYRDTIKDSRNGMFRVYQFLCQEDSLYLLPYRKD